MRAMILAAGRGQRMRPLSDHTPKPLLKVGGQALIVYHIKNLAQANIQEIVINLSHRGEKIAEYLGDGSRWGVKIQYSYEDPILETGGGIKHALKWLGTQPFFVVSGDIYTDYPFEQLVQEPKGLAHIILTNNPPFNSKGDYALIGEEVREKWNEGNEVENKAIGIFNFGGMGVYRPELFDLSDAIEGSFPLSDLFKKAIQQRAMTGEYYNGIWYNIGTEEQLRALDQILTTQVLTQKTDE